MSFGDVVDLGLRILFALGVPGAVVWYVRDRRKDRAASEVAEQTVPAEVRIKDADALNAHITAVERAFEVERESKDRQIRDQARQIKDLQDEVRQLKQRVAELTEALLRVRGAGT